MSASEARKIPAASSAPFTSLASAVDPQPKNDLTTAVDKLEWSKKLAAAGYKYEVSANPNDEKLGEQAAAAHPILDPDGQ